MDEGVDTSRWKSSCFPFLHEELLLSSFIYFSLSEDLKIFQTLEERKSRKKERDDWEKEDDEEDERKEERPGRVSAKTRFDPTFSRLHQKAISFVNDQLF